MMPVVSLPNGDEVEFPEGTSHEDMESAIHEHLNPPSKTWDFLRSIPRGVLKGAAGAASALGQGEASLSMPPEQAKEIPGAEEATRLAEKHLTGNLPMPQGGPGRYGETVGEFLGNPATWIGPGGPLAKGATAIGGALGSEAAGEAAAGSRWEPIARFAGALAGGHAITAAPRVITPNIISPERQALINTLQGEGVTGLTAGQRTGSRPLRWTESVAADVPFSGTSAADLNEATAGQFTRAALRRVGENAERATPEVVDRAFNRIGEQFDRLTGRSHLALDEQLGHDLINTTRNYWEMVPENARSPVVENTVRDLAQQAHETGGLTGEQYQALRSRLGRAARGSSDPQLSHALTDFTEHLDDAMERSMGEGTRDAFREARRQYRNLLVIERAAAAGGENAAQGFISPAQLGMAARNVMGRRAYARGQGEFADLSHAGNALMNPLPQSGTGPREAVMEMLRLGPILGGVEGLQGGGLAGVAGGVAAGAAAPALVSRAILHPWMQRYLANQAAPYRVGTSPASIAIMNEAARALRGGQ